MDINKYWIWLSKLEGITVREKLDLLEKYGIENLWNIDKAQAFDILKSNEKVESFFKNRDNLEKYLEYNYKNNIKILSINSKEYPRILRNIYDSPIVLYAKGNVEALQNPSFAIVGARSASEYGKKIAKTMAYTIASKNINIVSGLARGIDTYSHIGALNANKTTIAVMGTGLDTIYPKENSKLYMDILEKNGLILTEYLVGTKLKPINFPARNRIISGLSFGVLVVEASKNSGSLITADFALEQGKNIYAIPGNITSPNSIGTNELIKQGAKLVTNIEDILEDYGSIV